MFSSRFILTAFLAGMLPCMPAAAQDSDSGEAYQPLPLFADESILNVRIEGPLRTMLSERSNTEYYEGKLSHVDESGATHELDLGFRTRGNKRRNPETCKFPPVRLNFKKKQTKGTVFEGQDKLKLVAHCDLRSSKFEQYVLLEYLAYKILELHTPYSFRARLMRIEWVDTDSKNNAYEKFGFVIEHKNELSERFDMEVAELMEPASYSDLNRTQASIATLYQYMIANTDFSLVAAVPGAECCHNGILLTADSGEYFPVPYDFDWSGLINAPYASPNPRFKVRSVTSRVWRGHCSVSPEMNQTIKLFLENRQAVFDLVNGLADLNDSMRKRTIKFLTGFYDEISDSGEFLGEHVTPC